MPILALLPCIIRLNSSAFFPQWEDRMQKGLFRYDVTACQTKVLFLTNLCFLMNECIPSYSWTYKNRYTLSSCNHTCLVELLEKRADAIIVQGFDLFCVYFIGYRWSPETMDSLLSLTRAATSKRGQLSLESTRCCSLLMDPNSTLLKLGRKRSSSSLKQARMVKFSSFQMPRLMLPTPLVLLPLMYVLYCFNYISCASHWNLCTQLCSWLYINRSVPLNTGMCFLSLVFLSACHKGLTMKASCWRFTWQQKQGVHTSVWDTIAWGHLLPLITFTSRSDSYTFYDKLIDYNIIYLTGLFLLWC